MRGASPTIREYYRVQRCDDSDTRLGKRICSGFRGAAVIQVVTASLVCSVISDWTGRWVFFCMSIARGRDSASLNHIVYMETDEMTTAQLAVEGEVE
jgi:hypothetical protein